MKKFMALAFALFFAVTAAAQNDASETIQQTVLKGHLEQTVVAGEYIETIQILYENTGFAENYDPEYKEGSTKLTENFGLTKRWTKGPICEISGQMREDIDAGTYNAYIVVKDKDGKFFETELTFIVEEKPLLPISLELSDRSGEADQDVEAGKTITPIVFDYEGITSYSVIGLPSGLTYSRDEANQIILITGSVGGNVFPRAYEYKVTVKNDAGSEIVKTGKITVTGGNVGTAIEVLENEKQKVVAGNEIKPVVFQFANVPLDENLSAFNTKEGSLKGAFEYSVEGNKLTVSGTVDENMQDGSYSIKIIVKGENNCDTAFASVEVTHQAVVTKVSVTENASQTLNVGDSIKPIVFQIENGSDPKITNFPGGYELRKNGNTVTIVGLVEESARGQYDVVLSVTGVDNNASAKATIEVIPGKATLDVVEGCDNQEVVAGGEITPIVYKYAHVKSIGGSGLPAGLDVEQDKAAKQIKIYGTIKSNAAIKEYTYSFELTNFYDEDTTITGKIKVVETLSDSTATGSSRCVETPRSSSSETEGSSSSEGGEAIVASVAHGFQLGFVNNELSVALPQPSMVRVQVFDLMGHLVESFSEPVASSKSFSLDHLNKGNYVVRVESSRFARTTKVAVK